jgi:CubicO group peptidase (beta-lactamase class C family)
VQTNLFIMKKFFRILIGILLVLAVVYFFLPGYVQTALIYQTVDIDDYQIFENRTIEAGTPQPWPEHPKYNTYKLEEAERQELEELEPVAFLVIQDGQVRYEEYWDGYGTNSLSNSFSAGKSVVSLLIGIALDEGQIKSLDEKVYQYIPEFSKPSLKEITIKDVLTMSSGVNWDEAYKTPFSMTTEAYYGTDLPGLIHRLEGIETPGKKFKYLSGNTEILAMVVQSATGKTISDYASEKIWKKIGAEHDALWSLDHKDGMEKAYCCFNTNARDFARFGQLILNNGLWDSTQIVSGDYLKAATSPAIWLDGGDGKPLSYYGYQYWILNYKGMQIPYMRGILGQYIFAIKEKNTVIVRLGHDRSKEYSNFHPTDVYDYVDLGLKIIEN